jgi:hypothetical protein
MLYYPFPSLPSFDTLCTVAEQYMQEFGSENLYIRNVPFDTNIIQAVNHSLVGMGLPTALNFLCFKRKNYFDCTSEKIHVDFSETTNEIIHSSILIPVTGCANTKMYWYNGDYKLVTRKLQNTDYAAPEWIQPPNEFDNVEIAAGPMLAKVDVPHGATSAVDGSYRITLTMRLVGNPSFEEVVHKVKLYQSIF